MKYTYSTLKRYLAVILVLVLTLGAVPAIAASAAEDPLILVQEDVPTAGEDPDTSHIMFVNIAGRNPDNADERGEFATYTAVVDGAKTIIETTINVSFDSIIYGSVTKNEYDLITDAEPLQNDDYAKVEVVNASGAVTLSDADDIITIAGTPLLFNSDTQFFLIKADGSIDEVDAADTIGIDAAIAYYTTNGVLTAAFIIIKEGEPDIFLSYIELLYPEGFRFEYFDGETLDLAGLKVMGVYSDSSVSEITDFTVSQQHGTVLHCIDNDITIVLVTITYTEDIEHTYYVWITVLPVLTLPNVTLPSGTVGTAYNANVTPPTGGSGTYTYSAVVPAGLAMTSSGAITGTPNAAVSAQIFIVTVTDTVSGKTATAIYTITIASSGGGGNPVNDADEEDSVPEETIIENTEVALGAFEDWENPFADVKADDWFYEAVHFVNSKGLMTGMANDSFSPNANMTRAMIVTILYRVENGELKVENASPFTDVDKGAWYYGAVLWAYENGIVEGYGDGRFGPDDNITREQFAAILYRYAYIKDSVTTATTDLAAYTDAGQVSAYAEYAMKWANANDLITGRTADTLVPRGNATRAEAAEILMRFIENVLNGIENEKPPAG